MRNVHPSLACFANINDINFYISMLASDIFGKLIEYWEHLLVIWALWIVHENKMVFVKGFNSVNKLNSLITINSSDRSFFVKAFDLSLFRE